MQLLPRWVLTDKHPSFFETDSGSAIEQTARVYGKMNELIEEYNTFVDSVNEQITNFITETETKQDCFKRCITELIENYIKSIDIKIDKQDMVIDDAVKFMMDNIVQTATSIINEKIANGTLTVGLVYNEETEQVEIIASEV